MATSGFRSTLVPGVGPLDARIYIVGESPGRKEEELGCPFVGDAGGELDRILAAAGIERGKCYLDNISQRRPFGNKDAAFFPGGDPAEQYVEGIANIHKRIKKHKPNVVVAVGKYALWGLTQEDSITRWRGSIMECGLLPGVKVIPVLHPAYLLRGMWKMRNPTIWDFQKIKRHSEFPELRLPQYDVTVVEPGGDLDAALVEIMEAPWFVFDIEIFGTTKLACINFGLSETRGIVVVADGERTRQFFKSVLESNIPKCNQNIMFDMTWLYRFEGVSVKNPTFDTMLAAHALYPTLPHSLEFLTSVYTDQPFYKEDRKLWRATGDLGTLWDYGGKDGCVTYKVRVEEEKDLDRHKARDTANFMFSLVEPYAEATDVGMNCDVERMDGLRDDAEAQIKELQEALDASLGYQINPRSPTQVRDAIYGHLKLTPRKRRGKLTTRKEVLLDLAAKSRNPELTAIVRLRELHKFTSSYASRHILDEDGRFRCSHNISGTKTGRLSSTQTLWGAGTNLFNFPEKARQFVVPDEGFSFVVIDLSQAESVLTAFLADDEVEIDWFRQQLDGHTLLASMIFNKDPEDISFEERYLAKKCHHALNYRMGLDTFVLTVNKESLKTGVAILRKQGEQLRDHYIALRPALQAWWTDVAGFVKRHGYIENLFGRKMYFLDQWSDKAWNEVVAYNPQSTVSDIAHKQVLRYWEDPDMEALRGEGSIVMLNELYDGVTYQVRDELVDEVAPRLMKMMIQPLVVRGRDLIIPVDAKVGDKSWNKDEMREFGTLRE